MTRMSGLAARYGDLAHRAVPARAGAGRGRGDRGWHLHAGRCCAFFSLTTCWSNLGIALGYAAIGAFSMRVESFLLAFSAPSRARAWRSSSRSYGSADVAGNGHAAIARPFHHRHTLTFARPSHAEHGPVVGSIGTTRSLESGGEAPARSPLVSV